MADRPDLDQVLDTPARLAALAALPAHPKLPHLHAVAGMTMRTWGTTIRHLHAAHVVLRPGGQRGVIEPNPELIGLARLVLEYRRLHEMPPEGLVADTHHAAIRAVHQRGIETAWIVTGSELGQTGQAFGPSGDLEPFRAMRTNSRYVYFGGRRLTRWDHAFLYLLSQRDEFNPPPTRVPEDEQIPGPDAAAGHVAQGRRVEPPFRAQALFYAMTSPDLFRSPDFEKWARFYHLGFLVRRLTGQADGGRMETGIPRAFQDEVKRLRQELGVEEGWLAG